MVARDTYRWALIKHATTNPKFVSVAFPMPFSKYVLHNDKGPERNLKSYRSKTQLPTPVLSNGPTSQTSIAPINRKPSPLAKEVIYTPSEIEASKPKPTKSARTVRWIVDDEPYERVIVSSPPRRKEQPRSTEVSIRSPRSGVKRETSQQPQQQQQCRPQYKPVRGVSMWFTAV